MNGIAKHAEQRTATTHRNKVVFAILHLQDSGMNTERLFAGVEAKS